MIYVVGGCSETARFLQDFWCYNPETQQWRALTPMSCPRSQMGVAIIDHNLYVVGGTCKDQVLNSVERYSFKKVSKLFFFCFILILICESLVQS